MHQICLLNVTKIVVKVMYVMAITVGINKWAYTRIIIVTLLTVQL